MDITEWTGYLSCKTVTRTNIDTGNKVNLRRKLVSIEPLLIILSCL